MPLERHEVEKIAHLARLTLSEQQIPFYSNNISNILHLVEQINKADTQGIQPMAHPLENINQRLRPDDITEKNNRDKFLALAPATEAGLYLVPQVIETCTE